jgi:hypothetical protein
MEDLPSYRRRRVGRVSRGELHAGGFVRSWARVVGPTRWMCAHGNIDCLDGKANLTRLCSGSVMHRAKRMGPRLSLTTPIVPIPSPHCF